MKVKRGFEWSYVNQVDKSKSLILRLNEGGVGELKWNLVTFGKGTFWSVRFYGHDDGFFEIKITYFRKVEVLFIFPNLF